jgi:uncharacterized membrane protein YccC
MDRPTTAGHAGLRAWLFRHDPDHDVLHRAIRITIVVPLLLLVTLELIGNAQLVSFAVFGSAAFLLFTEFPGDRAARCWAYIGLTLAGAVLIVLGTVLATPWWLAGLGMAVVGFGVNFAGVLSSAVAAAGRAALLAFILPVTLPGGLPDLAPRLIGWAIAAAVSIPAALFLLPSTYHDVLRARVADCCRAVSALCRAEPGNRGELDVAAKVAVRRLRSAFASTDARPVGLSTGSRFLIRIVDDLGWLRAAVSAGGRIESHTGLSAAASAELRGIMADLLESSAAAIDPKATPQSRAAGRERLDADLHRTLTLRRSLGQHTLEALVRLADSAAPGSVSEVIGAPETPAGDAARDLETDRTWHAAVHAALLTGATVAVAAAADARPVLDRLLGRHRPVRAGVDPMGIWPTARSIAGGQLTTRGVAFRNAVRVGLGLGLAILVAEWLGVGHAFWVGLGAMSVLRSRALATTGSAWRALLGTTIGFAIGSVLILLLGTSPAVLWPIIPVALIVAGLAPVAVSFTVGQAAFTVLVLALFNLLEPVGWSVGVVRVEDVLLGCGASLLAGLIAWPQGASSALDDAIRESIRAAAAELGESMAGRTTTDPEVKAANTRADDALRGVLAERAGKLDSVERLSALVATGVRLRLAAEAIAPLADRARSEEAAHSAAATGNQPATTDALGAITIRAERLADSFRALADRQDLPTCTPPEDRPAAVGTPHDAALLTALRSATVDEAAAVLWIDLYLDDLEQLLTMFKAPDAGLPSAAAPPVGAGARG